MKEDAWMVRTERNEILGPYTKESLISEIQQGKFGPDDEVCRANHYWIHLDERDEVMKQLGIELHRPGLPAEDNEVTDTQTLTQEMVGRKSVVDREEKEAFETLPELSEEIPEESTVMTNRALRRFEPKTPSPQIDRSALKRAQPSRPFVIGRVERPSIWRFVISALVIMAAFLIAWIIRVLQTAR